VVRVGGSGCSYQRCRIWTTGMGGSARHGLPRSFDRPVAVRFRLPAAASHPAQHRQQRPDGRPLRVRHVTRVARLPRPVVGGISELVSQTVTLSGDQAGLPGHRHGRLRHRNLLLLLADSTPTSCSEGPFVCAKRPRSPDRDSCSKRILKFRNDNSFSGRDRAKHRSRPTPRPKRHHLAGKLVRKVSWEREVR
jgi:hypothetical protein